MNKQLTWKVAVIFVVLIASLWSMWPPKDKIKLGIDLQGGTEFKLQVDLSKAEVAGRGQALLQAVET